MGKGSKRRPSQISQSELERRWQQAFGTKKHTNNGLKNEPPTIFQEPSACPAKQD